MVDRVGIGQGFNISAKSSLSSNKTSNFMDVLKNKFDEVTSKLQNVPGMPGVYAVNQSDLASLNITDISDQTTVSSLI